MAVTLPHNPRDEEVDMAPMIDMVFLLLVFFMVSSHLQSEDFIELDIPKASAAKIPEDRGGRLVVSVTVEGDLYLGPEPIEASALEEILVRRNDDFLASTDGETRLKLFLRAHADTGHGDVRKVMRMAAEAGILDIIFSTHEDLEGS